MEHMEFQYLQNGMTHHAVCLHMATYMLLPRWRSQLNLSRIHA